MCMCVDRFNLQARMKYNIKITSIDIFMHAPPPPPPQIKRKEIMREITVRNYTKSISSRT